MDSQLKRRQVDIIWYKQISTTRKLDRTFEDPPTTIKGYISTKERTITVKEGQQYTSNITVILEYTTYPIKTLDEMHHPVFGRLPVKAVYMKNHPMTPDIWDAEVIL